MYAAHRDADARVCDVDGARIHGQRCNLPSSQHNESMRRPPWTELQGRPQCLRSKAHPWAGAKVMGAHSSCVAIGDRDVVEQQFSTAHPNDGPR